MSFSDIFGSQAVRNQIFRTSPSGKSLVCFYQGQCVIKFPNSQTIPFLTKTQIRSNAKRRLGHCKAMKKKTRVCILSLERQQYRAAIREWFITVPHVKGKMYNFMTLMGKDTDKSQPFLLYFLCNCYTLALVTSAQSTFLDRRGLWYVFIGWMSM